MNNNILIIVIVAAALYLMSAGTGTAATAQNGQGCLQAIQQQYSGQWAEMNQVQRAMVGLRAASCEEGR